MPVVNYSAYKKNLPFWKILLFYSIETWLIKFGLKYKNALSRQTENRSLQSNTIH